MIYILQEKVYKRMTEIIKRRTDKNRSFLANTEII